MPIELAFVSIFPNPYGKNTRKKLEKIAKDLWEPDTEDFLKVIGQSKLAKIQDILETKNIIDFCGAILLKDKKNKKERDDGSIARIDLITHSSPDWIALSGTIFYPEGYSSKAKVFFEEPKDDKGLNSHYFYPCITEHGLNSLDDYDIVISDQQKKKQWTLADVRKKFALDAKLVIYSCEAGTTISKTGISPLLKHIAKTVGFKEVGAFTKNIKYEYVNGKIFLSVEESSKKLSPNAKTFDYRALDSSSYFVSYKG